MHPGSSPALRHSVTRWIGATPASPLGALLANEWQLASEYLRGPDLRLQSDPSR